MRDDLPPEVAASKHALDEAVTRIVLLCVEESPVPLAREKTIHVLMGLDACWIRQHRLHTLQTFGVLAFFSVMHLRRVIDHLFASGLLAYTGAIPYGRWIKVTAAGQRVLRGTLTVKVPLTDLLNPREGILRAAADAEAVRVVQEEAGDEYEEEEDEEDEEDEVAALLEAEEEARLEQAEEEARLEAEREGEREYYHELGLNPDNPDFQDAAPEGLGWDEIDWPATSYD